MVHHNLEQLPEGRSWQTIQNYSPAIPVNRDMKCGKGCLGVLTESLLFSRSNKSLLGDDNKNLNSSTEGLPLVGKT